MTARLRAALRGASLRTRIMAAAAFLVIVTSLVTGVLGVTLLRGFLLARSDTQLRDFARISQHIVNRPRRARPVAIGPHQQLPAQFLVELISAGGQAKVVGSPVHEASRPRLSPEQLRDLGSPFTVPASGASGQSWRVLVQRLPGGRRVVIGYPLGDLDGTVTELETYDALAVAVAVGLLAGLGLPLVRTSLRPLTRIQDTAAAIAGGDLSQRIDHPPANTEVGRLAGALDTMLATIEAAYRARADGEARAVRSEDRMRRFVADASHELRTPLTAVRGLSEYGLQQGEAVGQADLLRLLTLIQQESARMSRLVEDLLLLARFDAGPPLDRAPVDLASIAAQAVSQARFTHPGKPIALRAAEPVIVWADAVRVRQVIDNLVGNAVQHTPAGTAVTVTVTCTAEFGELTVADRGPGLTPEQAARVFERFYRTDRARSRASGGTGLGLSIASALTAAHDGQLSVDSAPGQGAVFRVRLPADRPAAATGSQGQLP
jgi:two-component system OmpR family sensor kinase